MLKRWDGWNYYTECLSQQFRGKVNFFPFTNKLSVIQRISHIGVEGPPGGWVRCQEIWVQIPALPLTSWQLLGTLLDPLTSPLPTLPPPSQFTPLKGSSLYQLRRGFGEPDCLGFVFCLCHYQPVTSDKLPIPFSPFPHLYKEQKQYLSVMVNSRCQPDWATGCPDIWLNTILGVSVEVFLDDITFELVDQIKKIALSNVGGPHPISWRPE